MSKLRRILPGYRKEGMGITAKVLMVALPVVAFAAGKMLGDLMGDDKS